MNEEGLRALEGECIYLLFRDESEELIAAEL